MTSLTQLVDVTRYIHDITARQVTQVIKNAVDGG